MGWQAETEVILPREWVEPIRYLVLSYFSIIGVLLLLSALDESCFQLALFLFLAFFLTIGVISLTYGLFMREWPWVYAGSLFFVLPLIFSLAILNFFFQIFIFSLGALAFFSTWIYLDVSMWRTRGDHKRPERWSRGGWDVRSWNPPPLVMDDHLSGFGGGGGSGGFGGFSGGSSGGSRAGGSW